MILHGPRRRPLRHRLPYLGEESFNHERLHVKSSGGSAAPVSECTLRGNPATRATMSRSVPDSRR